MSIIEKIAVYNTANGDPALFHTSKTAKMIKVILLRAPCQNVNVLLSNITFIIFAVFWCVKQCRIAVNSVINCSFFCIIFAVFLYLQAILSIVKVAFRIRRPAHATTSSTIPFDSPCPISYRYSIATKSVSPVVFEIMGIKHNGVITLTSVGHVTSSVTWPFDSPCPISDRYSIAANSESPAVFEILGTNILGSRPWPLGWCDDIPGRHFIGAPLSPALYLQPFSR